MPVLFGASKLFPKYLLQKKESKLNEQFRLHKAFNDFDIEVKEGEEAKTDEEKRMQKSIQMALEHPFVKMKVTKKEKQYDGMIGSIIRYDEVHLAIQEFFLSAET